MVRLRRSARGRGPFRRLCGGRCTIAIADAASRAVGYGSARVITSGAHGGPTTLSNLAMLCRRHHRAVHEDGYQVERQPDGELRFRRPDGRPLPESPPLPAVPSDPVGMLRTRNEECGLDVHARTAMPGWLGERLDPGWA